MIKKKIFKWVGGKKWLKEPLSNVIKNQCSFNPEIDTYIEPCSGGLGSFLSLSETLIESNIKKVYLNDINEVLISTFKHLKVKNFDLFNEYLLIEKVYANKIPAGYKEIKKNMEKDDIKKNLTKARDFYLKSRVEYNKIKDTDSIRRSALFIFLMQHAFNGVYRENNSGGFNVPYNWEPNIINVYSMQKIFEAYKTLFLRFDVVFSNLDIFDFFETEEIKEMNWKRVICYIDPPYMNEKNNELKYTAGGFGKPAQNRLLSTAKEIGIINIIYSNYDFKLFRNFADLNGLAVKQLSRNSRINPSKSKNINELLIYKEYK